MILKLVTGGIIVIPDVKRVIHKLTRRRGRCYITIRHYVRSKPRSKSYQITEADWHKIFDIAVPPPHSHSTAPISG